MANQQLQFSELKIGRSIKFVSRKEESRWVSIWSFLMDRHLDLCSLFIHLFVFYYNQHLISPSRPFTLETVAFRHGEFSNPLENQDEHEQEAIRQRKMQ
ncbi:hypothetical protein F2Q68_00025809 [Brassica cretica]|uniref:Uncharacterized protein n=1 Tax=Brassica cretica TaxID=69181 RepID=A0A8S9IDZ6_BRACR|nr:hypothetical protein F2Q68_00025809 [Brassica cretica]